MVGDLYQEGDHRRDGAFTIFYMGINIGAFLSGIIVGEVVNAFGTQTEGGQVIRHWQSGFAAAGIGMLISLVLQGVFAKKYLGDIGVEPNAKKSKAQNEGNNAPLTKEEFDRIKVIFIMGVFTIIFWAGFEQAGGLLNIYADRFTDRFIGDWQVPTTYFQSLNPFFIVVFAPIIASFWIRLGDKEPTSPVKFGIGLVLLGVGFLFMVGATLAQGENGGKTSMMWLVLAYLFHTLGELCLSPIGLSMVTKLAPLKLASVMMGAWFFFTGLANKVAGLVGSLVGTHGKEATFEAQCVANGVAPEGLKACVEAAKEAMMVENALGIFSGIAIATILSGIILFLIADKLIHWMHGAEGVEHSPTVEEELEISKEHG
jgi:POT family proton-dependent oligopeptide transporter